MQQPVAALLAALAAWVVYSWVDVTVYQLTTAVRGVGELLSLDREDIEKCTEAYEYFIGHSTKCGTAGCESSGDTMAETEHVRAYYKVINYLLSIADIEKMYIPPQLDAKKGLYANQLLTEAMLAESLQVGNASTLLDIGCGRGRIAHHMAALTGGHVKGFNIDESQINNAIEYAKGTGMEERLDFRVGDHHQPFQYADRSFDGAYSFQAVWPFFKKHELDGVAAEIFRVLKPGARFSCSEYLLTPDFNHADAHHVALHKLFLPTLAATQSNYPADVVTALERAGFTLILSAPSLAPAWPLTDQKTDLFLWMRSAVIGFTKVGVLDPWATVLVNNLLKGGVAWADAEKAKIADLNWRIVAVKPMH